MPKFKQIQNCLQFFKIVNLLKKDGLTLEYCTNKARWYTLVFFSSSLGKFN